MSDEGTDKTIKSVMYCRSTVQRLMKIIRNAGFREFWEETGSNDGQYGA